MVNLVVCGKIYVLMNGRCELNVIWNFEYFMLNRIFEIYFCSMYYFDNGCRMNRFFWKMCKCRYVNV